MAIYQNITQLVGKTPVIKLNNIVPEGASGSLCEIRGL